MFSTFFKAISAGDSVCRRLKGLETMNKCLDISRQRFEDILS